MTERRRLPIVLIVACVAAAPFAAAHMFNHQTRHEDCEVYGAPHGHTEADGHAHWHHNAAAAAAHNHGATPGAAGHTHAFVAHDPCNQVGMVRQGYAGMGPIHEIPVQQAVIGIPGLTYTDVVIGDEAFRIPVPELEERNDLIIDGDRTLRAMGFPGTGTAADPFIIEGYLIRNVLLLKDTSLCVVVRNNVIQNNAVIGPIIDPDDIIDRRLIDDLYDNLTAALERQIAAAEDAEEQAWDVLEPYAQQAADMAALLTGYQAQSNAFSQQSSSNSAMRAAVDAAIRSTSDRLGQFGVRLDGVIAAYEQAADDFEAFLGASGPTGSYQSAANDQARSSGLASHMDQFAQFAQHQAQAQAAQAWQDAYNAHMATLSTLASQHAALAATTAELQARLADLNAEAARLASGGQATQAARDAFEREFSQFRNQHAAFLTTYTPQADAYQALVDQVDALREQLQQARRDQAANALAMVDGLYEYAGNEYDSLAELARNVSRQIAELLDKTKTGRLIFDWNGQCLHAHHNVVQDLRVNRNNKRTGFATGGLTEDNRIYTIGQIRHYDGEFRENEVGKRAFLYGLVPDDPRHVPLPVKERSINNDGANQGWFHHNLIYGSVDLDLHGHHHGAGFFSPESHYHGSDKRVGYMYDASGNPVLLPNGKHAPHHDHAKRWTTIRFEDNVVIDPLGYGIRYEDRDHAGDDRFANSEDMRELDYPHFHKTWVVVSGNTVVGSVWADVFNAGGIEVWDDDWTAVKRDTVGRILDAVNHLGASVVSTHPVRNNGWLDLTNNAVFVYDKVTGTTGGHYGWSAIQFNDGIWADLAAVTGNKAFVLPRGMDPGFTDAYDLVQYLQDAHTRSPATTASTVASWATAARPANSPQLIGFLLKNLKDMNVTVCNNNVLGYQVGLKATDRIYTDVNLVTCASNNWGSASPRVDVRFTNYPPPVLRVTDPLRDLTDPTSFRYVAEPVYDVVDPGGGALATPVNDAWTTVAPYVTPAASTVYGYLP